MPRTTVGTATAGPSIPSSSAPVRVLHVTGSGRSGSTLLTSALGSAQGVFAAGELRFLWERALVLGEPCGCGSTIHECDVWGGVMARLGPIAEPPSASDTHLRLRAIIRLRHAARFFLRRRELNAGETQIADRLAKVYSAISEQTGAQVIVDSSKLPTYAALLDEVPNLDVYVLHLVRDPRAAAYSWSLGHSSSSLEEMDELAPVKSSVLWVIWNGLTALHWGNGSKYLRLRYEDVMADPQGSLRKIANFVDIDPDLLPFTAPDEVMVAPNHVVAGNPNRRHSGRTRFRLDRRWETGLRRRDRYLVTSLCAVLLHRMGYSLRVRK